jgi:hypothetical protein
VDAWLGMSEVTAWAGGGGNSRPGRRPTRAAGTGRGEASVERYEIEGSTVLGWTVTVDARGRGAAVEEAQRIASRIDLPAAPLRVHVVDHRVVRCDDVPEAGALCVEIW